MIAPTKRLNFTPRVVSELSLEDILHGGLFILPRLLQQSNFYRKFVLVALDVIRHGASTAAADQVAEGGLERLHKFVPPFLLPGLLSEMATRLSSSSANLLHATAMRFRPTPPCLYLADRTWARIMMPEDVIADYRDTLADQYGHAVVHNPHRDSWFSQPLNAINVWIALGHVSLGNSLLIYPEVFGQNLERDGRSVAKSQALGMPLSFDLNAGDALLFNGEHLHSSAINATNETRFVVSLRFTKEPPSYTSSNQTTYREIQIVRRRATP